MPLSAEGAPSILVIDDEVAVLRLLSALLGRANYQVTTAETANEALGILEKTSFDCVITDAVMPDLSGYDFVKAVRSHPQYAELPILMLTRKRHRQDVKKAVEAGVTDYIFKPIDDGLLLEKVEHVLKKCAGTRASAAWFFQGGESDGELGVGCKLHVLSESELVVYVPFKLEAGSPLRLKTGAFADAGLGSVAFKLASCERPPAAAKYPGLAWEAKLPLDSLSDTDKAKLRTWLQKRLSQSPLRAKPTQ